MKTYTPWPRLLVRLAGWLALLVLLVPLVYAMWVSFAPGELLAPPTTRWSLRWYRRFFSDPRWIDSLINSLHVAALSTVVSLLSGGGLALAVTRYHFRGRRLLSRAVLLPLFVPAVVLGMGLLPLAHVTGLWGSPLSLALAHALNSLPVVFLVLRSALDEVSPDLELAARGLGAGTWRTFARVTIPLVGPAVKAGAVMALLLSLNEFTLALFLATPEIETLPRVIWPELRYNLSPLVAAASCVMMLLTLTGVACAAGLKRLSR
jgi:ABC-type spermidine/putrescine transport system permease subunit II